MWCGVTAAYDCMFYLKKEKNLFVSLITAVDLTLSVAFIARGSSTMGNIHYLIIKSNSLNSNERALNQFSHYMISIDNLLIVIDTPIYWERKFSPLKLLIFFFSFQFFHSRFVFISSINRFNCYRSFVVAPLRSWVVYISILATKRKKQMQF